MKHAIALSWRRVRRGIPFALPLLWVGGAYVGPMKTMLLDSGVAIPNSLFVMWLAGRLFCEDDERPDEAHLRALPLDPGRVLLARALFGLALCAGMLILQLPLWYFGPSAWLRGTIFADESVFLPPGDMPLLLSYLWAIFGGTAWFAKSLGHVAASKGGHWLAWFGVPIVALHTILLGGPMHAYVVPILFLTGVFGLLGAARCARRREVWAGSANQWVMGPPRRRDALFTLPAQLLLVVVPFLVIAMAVARVLLEPWGEPWPATAAVCAMFGLVSLPVAHAEARHRGLGFAGGLGLYALALSGLGWAIWHTLRRPHPRDGMLGRWRLPFRLDVWMGIALLVFLGVSLLGHVFRPFQNWRVVVQTIDFDSQHSELLEDAEILVDGERIGRGSAEGWRLRPVLGDFNLGEFKGAPVTSDLSGVRSVEARDLIAGMRKSAEADDVMLAYRELQRSLPDGRFEVRLGDRLVPLRMASAQSSLRHGCRSTVLTLLVDASSLVSEFERWRATFDPSEEDLERWAAEGDALWREIRRRMPAGQIARRNAAGEWDKLERLPEDQQVWRNQKLARLGALLERRYGSSTEASFERIWSDLKSRRRSLRPPSRGRYNIGPRRDFHYLEPQLRALAALQGEARHLLDERLAAGDPHAALAAGLRADPSDAPVLERLLTDRRRARARVNGGILRMDVDERALMYGWALLAVDRARGTEVLRGLLGEPDPLPPELLVINDGSPALVAEVERWLRSTDADLARAWRLRDGYQAQELRKLLQRVSYGARHPVSPLDYFEQSPGFLALMTPE